MKKFVLFWTLSVTLISFAFASNNVSETKKLSELPIGTKIIISNLNVLDKGLNESIIFQNGIALRDSRGPLPRRARPNLSIPFCTLMLHQHEGELLNLEFTVNGSFATSFWGAPITFLADRDLPLKQMRCRTSSGFGGSVMVSDLLESFGGSHNVEVIEGLY